MDADLSDGLEKGMGYVHIENDIPIRTALNTRTKVEKYSEIK